MKRMILVFAVCLFAAACQTLPTSSEYLARGDGYFKDGKIEQALKAYDKALALNPDRTDIYASRGAAYLKKGDEAKAQDDFNIAKGGQFPQTLNEYSMIE